MKVKNRFIHFLLILSIFSCKSKNFIEKYTSGERISPDKFVDSYSNYEYINDSLGFSISFNDLWIIKSEYSHFNDFEKSYSDFFVSNYGEVLFIGYNEKDKIGVRCTSESLNMTNNDYLQSIKSSFSKEVGNYKIETMNETMVKYDHYSAINYVFSLKLNALNIFVFDSLFFKNEKYNIRLDFWTEKKLYNENKIKFREIYESINFRNSISDLTSDTSNDK